MQNVMLEWIGWIATAVFACSYFFRKPEALRKVQAAAAVLWIGYGMMIHALPVIVSNVVVATIALGSLAMEKRRAARVNS